MKTTHKLALAPPPRPFPVATGDRQARPYEHMNPRAAAIRLLDEKLRDRAAGLDVYDDTVFIMRARPNEIVWARRCLNLLGVPGIESAMEDGSFRLRGFLEPDVRLALGLDLTVGDDIVVSPAAPRVDDEPLASRAVGDHVGVLTSIERAHAAYGRRYPFGVEQVH